MIASRNTLSKEDGERLQYEVDKSLKVFTQTNLGTNTLMQLIQRCAARQSGSSHPVALEESTLRPSASVLMAGEGYKTSGRVAPVPRTLLDPPRALSKSVKNLHTSLPRTLTITGGRQNSGWRKSNGSIACFIL